ncbi:MAG: M3 family oligoendopeptidase [Anaerolineales bacterium]
MNKENSLPHWDMTVPYPSLQSEAFKTAFDEAAADLKALEGRFDEAGIELHEESLPVAESVGPLEMALEGLNDLGRRLHTLYAYVVGYAATDSRNATAQAYLSRIHQQRVRYEQLQTRFAAWVGALDVAGVVEASPLAAGHAFALHRAAVKARHLMSPEEEQLASDLSLTGSIAWHKLYTNFTSQILVELEVEGEQLRLPMTAVRNLAFEPEREVRRTAYEAELGAWEAHELPIAAALNSIKGETLALSERRGWESPLDLALFANNIDRETLEALTAATEDFFPDLRRYLRAKARALGVSQLAWYDLFAPVGEPQAAWTFEEAQRFILKHFNSYSGELSGMARRAFEERWIDAEPRDGKRGGAFCLWLRDGESRILANYQPAYGGVGTLAHELGHAFHNLMRADRTYIQRDTPMTLAETASNFCEMLVQEAALARAERDEQIYILEASLQDSLQVTVDITSRIIFEKQVFERRRDRELSAEEFKSIMLEAQRATYGDALDPEALHPYMWAVKPHYYGSTFYNFPYLFGHLFSLGLYAHYRENPEGFKEGYEALLSSTGMDDAATLAQRFGIDVRTQAFWRSSLEILRDEIERFEALITERAEEETE